MLASNDIGNMLLGGTTMFCITRRRPLRCLSPLRLLMLAVVSVGVAVSADRQASGQATWTGTASGVWSNAANWVGTAPTSSGTSALGFVSATSGSAITATNDLTGLTLSSLTLGSPRDMTLAGNAFTLTGGITNTTGNWQTVALPIALAAGDRAVSVTTGRLFLTGSLSGAAALVKTNAGDLVLGGPNTLTGNGTLVINGTIAGSGTVNRALELNGGFGNVYLTNTAALGSAANYVLFNNTPNGTLHLQTDASMAGYSLSVSSFQSITISVDRATAGAAVTHTLGTLNIGSSSATFNRGANVTGVATVGLTLLSMSAGADHQPVTIGGNAQIAINAAYNTNNTFSNRRLQLDGSFTGNTIGMIGDVIPGGPAGVGVTSVIKANSSTWVLTGSNAYTGSTTINQGTLQLGNGGTTGSIRPASAITGAAGATLAFNRSDTITQGTDFASTISGSLGLVKMGAGNLVLSGSNSLGSGSGSLVLLFSNANSGTVTLRNAAALGAAGNLVRFTGGGSGVLDLQADASVNSFDAASGSGNGGTIIVNRATPGVGVMHTMGVLDMSSVTFTATTGSNVTSGTAGLAVTEVRMTGGNDNNPVTLAGNATWAVGSASITSSGISKRLQLDGTAGGNTIGPISNTTNATAGAIVNLIKANSGTWTLTGANTYTGTTTISQGTLRVGASGTAGSLSPSSPITGSAGATLAFNRSNVVTQGTDFTSTIGGAINLAQLGSGTLILNGANTYSGTTTITAGTLQVGSGSSTGSLGSGPIVNHGALVYNLAGTIVNVPQNVSGTGSLSMSLVSTANSQYIQFANGTTSLGGPISIAGNGASSSGFYRGMALSSGTTTLAGSAVTLSGNMGVGGSNGSGVMAIDTSASNGAISLDISLGRNGSWYLPIGLTANSGTGQLVVSGSNAIGGWNTSGGVGTALTGGLAISSTIAFNEKTALRATAASTVSGNLTLAGTANTLTVDGGVGMTVSGILGGSGAGFTKLGLGTLTLSANNTFSGPTSIAAGILAINGTSALAGTSGLTIAGGAGLTYTGGAATFGKNVTVIAGSGTGTITNAGSGLLTLSGSLSKDNSVLRLTGGSFNITGMISGATPGASDLLVDGTSSVTLSSANTYDGPTFVNQSSNLIVGVANAIPSNSVVTLGSVTTTGTLSLGLNSNAIGGLRFGAGGGTLRMTASGTGSTAQLTAASGTLTLTNGTLDLGGSGTSAGYYRLLSAQSVAGALTNITGTSAAYQVLTTATSVDYQQRAVLGAVTVTNPAISIITGGTAAFTYAVANSALSGGASLAFTGAGLSNVAGSSSGSAGAASPSGPTSGLFFNGTTVGANQQGLFTVTAPAAYGATSTSGTVSVTVLDHALPGFSASGITNPYADAALSIDFGTIDETDGPQNFAYSLVNLASLAHGAGLTAGLDFTGVTADGDGFASGLTTFDNLVAGGTSSLFTATFTPSGQGSFSRQFTLSFFDNRNLAGAAARRDLTINAQVIVVPEPGGLVLVGGGVAIASWVGWMARKSRRSRRPS